MLIKAFKVTDSGLWSNPEVTRAAPFPKGQGERLFPLEFNRLVPAFDLSMSGCLRKLSQGQLQRCNIGTAQCPENEVFFSLLPSSLGLKGTETKDFFLSLKI